MSNSTNPVLKQTPLFEEHIKLGAKMIGFGGWNMPVFYSSILDEHQAVRQHVGIFDISHMGQIEVSGPAAKRWLNAVLTNNVERLDITHGQYTLLLNERGGVIDDLIIYRRHDNDYFLVVNAAKIEEDFAWMRSRLTAEVSLSDRSASLRGSRGTGSQVARFTPAVRGSAGPESNEGNSNPWHSCLGGPHRIHG